MDFSERVILIDALDNMVSLVTLPGKESILQEVKNLIGEDCEVVCDVYPRRLYEDFGQSWYKNQRVFMMVDDMSRGKQLPVNALATWLYNGENANTGVLIYGNAVLVQENYMEGFGGLWEDAIVEILPQFSDVASALRRTKLERRRRRK